ncbi:MAG: AAA family ATPase [Nitrospinales bacterium]
MGKTKFVNPFKPGAGHMPPYLAGRSREIKEFEKLLKQDTILDNLVLTGLRGVGKTVLLERFKEIAIQNNWLWVGTDMSESASIGEEQIILRLLTDLSTVTSNMPFKKEKVRSLGFASQSKFVNYSLSFENLRMIYRSIPGLAVDKLKGILDLVWRSINKQKPQGLIFAYDEAQTISNHPKKEEYPLSLFLDAFQSIQKKDIPFMLVLTGLPTLFPKLVDARTFAERMFRVVFLDKLDKEDSRDAIVKPIQHSSDSIVFEENSIKTVVKESSGYPYFIQFICREVYDIFLQKRSQGKRMSVPIDIIIRKLDADFFAGRWAKATDRQRELLLMIAKLENCDQEFTVQEVVEISKKNLEKPFGSSHINQMLSTLSNLGLVYKNRHGKYSFAVPLFGKFILRQETGLN